MPSPSRIDEDISAHLLFREVVLNQTAHNLLGRPGCADMRSHQTAQDMF